MNPQDIKDVRIAVIGGSGLYHLDNLTKIATVNPETPWGFPSAEILIAKTPAGSKIAFLSRHGKGHVYNPTEIPVRANIAALKSIGVKVILAFSAVGSLREEIKPRDFVIPTQIIDRTKGIRPGTFFENGVVCHAMFGDPFHVPLTQFLSQYAHTLQNATLHTDKTLVCMEGPAFSTRAESNLYRSWDADIINMSAVPESKLAREAEIAYAMICMSTDYDCWRHEEEAVTVEAVIANLNANSENAKRLIVGLLPSLETAVAKDHFEGKQFLGSLEGSMKMACITAPERRNKEQVEKLNYILTGYY